MSIIVINVVVFCVLELFGSTEDAEYMALHGAAYTPWIYQYQEYYRLFTCMFMHFGISHLMNNMVVLFLLGDNVERAVGRWKYLVIYLMSGMAGSILSYAHAILTGDYAVSAGASGAIFGVIGALFYIVAVNKGRLEDMTTRKLGLLIVISLYHGFTGSGVDNYAHIGGLAAGALLAAVLYRKKENHREKG
ncbi:MAG: rhomboid family intramembrane serine protease [Lachnospiraceae bacterium]|nr:rhomboid family intramembrane serine protease [Lachnospiraceae bacterium]